MSRKLSDRKTASAEDDHEQRGKPMLRSLASRVRDRDIAVSNGTFVINDVDVVRSTGNLLVLECDCRSKYPDSFAYSGTEVLVFPGEHTLHPDETSSEATVIRLPRRCEDWVVVATGARYTIRIVAYSHSRRFRRRAWQRTRGEGR
jgi:hypothetical protein